MSDTVRAHLLITGRVQGVFFRMETKRAAEARGVNGWVRNLPDGRVEAVVEGEVDQVQSLIEWCGHGPARARVDSVDTHQEPARNAFTDFRITG